MQKECDFWLALGEDRAKVLAFMAENAAVAAAVKAVVQEIGGEDYVTRGNLVAGVTFLGDECPDGWKEVTAMAIGDAWRKVYFPKASTKALRDVAAKLHAHRFKNGRDLAAAFNTRMVIRPGENGGMRLLSLGAGTIGENAILLVPLTKPGEPPAFESAVSRKLLMSEYWLLREANGTG